jgi:hypothetical protein
MARRRAYLSRLSNNPIAGALSGAFATPAGNYNLTALGITDWASWGFGGVAPGFTDSSTGGGKISNAIGVGAGLSYYGGNPVTFTWTNGAPNSAATAEANGIYVQAGTGTGLSFTVPAGTTPRTLTIYVSTYNCNGMLTATLSDGSAAPYVDTSLSGSSQGEYTITYNAASAGQTLTISWLNNGGTNVALEAATLV